MEGALPRHLRRNLFDVFRLLLPHNDNRRYYWGAAGIAKAVGEAMGLDKAKAERLSESWHDAALWASGFGRTATYAWPRSIDSYTRMSVRISSMEVMRMMRMES